MVVHNGDVHLTERLEFDLKAGHNGAWRPQVFDPSVPSEREHLEALLHSGLVVRVCDTIRQQILDLADARRFGRSLCRTTEAEIVRSVTADVGLDEYGRWIFYPWSGTLVHLLAPDEFRELRLDRNRPKITGEEQRRLSRITVGIAGLSVGNAVALTLVQEGIVGHMRLADFDELSLSNLNRLRARVEDLGAPKVILAARQIAELDPYLSVSVITEGVNRHNLGAFLDGPPNLDVLVEESDGLAMKLLMRVQARRRRIPVLMETSDRGMLDVERFDLEPERQILHGSVGDLDVDAMPDTLDDDTKLRLVLAIIGPTTLSARAAAAMLEIRHSVSTWPQLASDVVLGGASISWAVRQIALGLPLDSGRRFLDIDALLNTSPVINTLEEPNLTGERAECQCLFTAHKAGAVDVPEAVLDAVAHAVLAPSGGNCQPWEFVWDTDRVLLRHHRARSATHLDLDRRASLAALGAAIENMAVAAAASRNSLNVQLFPCERDTDLVASLHLQRDLSPEIASLAKWLPEIKSRATNRRITQRVELPERHFDLLRNAAGSEARVDIVTCPILLDELGEILGVADRIRILNPIMHRELVTELRFSPEAAREGLGIDIESLELGPAAAAAIRIIARPDVTHVLRAIQGGSVLAEGTRKALGSASAAVLISALDGDPASVIRGGRAMQRVWLAATRLGLGFHPMTAGVYMFDIAERVEACPFSGDERTELVALHTRFNQVMPTPDPAVRLLLARVFVAPPPTVRSYRLPLADVLVTSSAVSCPPENQYDSTERDKPMVLS